MSVRVGERRVAALVPMVSELKPFVRALSLRPERLDDLDVHSGRADDVEVVAMLTRIGMGPAAEATERLIDAVDPTHVVVLGVCGGVGSAVRVGDLVVPDTVVDHATGAEYRPMSLGNEEPHGRLVTTDAFIADRRLYARLASEGVVAVDMETAAIAEVCVRRQRPWSVFRAVSDHTDQTTAEGVEISMVRPDGSPNLSAVLRYVAGNPLRIGHLGRLARGTALATRVAAKAAAQACPHA